MEKLSFQILLNAPRQKVWDSLWEDESYRKWTSAFMEGSRAESDWKKGSKIRFLDGKGSGMVSVIEEMVQPSFMSFRHEGEIKNGVENTENAKTQGWAGSHENYTLTDVEGKTQLTVEMDGWSMPADMMEYFRNTWPRALAILKEMVEKE